MPRVPPSSRSVNLAVDPLAVTVLVPVRVAPAGVAPAGLALTETSPAKLSTSLPDTSSALTAGWVVKATRFTAPLAAVTISRSVAVP